MSLNWNSVSWKKSICAGKPYSYWSRKKRNTCCRETLIKSVIMSLMYQISYKGPVLCATSFKSLHQVFVEHFIHLMNKNNKNKQTKTPSYQFVAIKDWHFCKLYFSQDQFAPQIIALTSNNWHCCMQTLSDNFVVLFWSRSLEVLCVNMLKIAN